MKPTFQGEVQFRRWSDSSTQGVQVTFALPDSDALEPLKGLEGKRFMAVLVQIGDDEQPVQPPVKVGPLCIEASDLCKLPEFRRFLRESGFPEVRGVESARCWILDTCVIDSRKELDSDAQAAGQFKTWIRIPFMKWQREQRK